MKARFLLACAVGSLAWIVCEVAGGLLFLAAGLRLWRYEIAPVFQGITSPVVWLLALLLIVPVSTAYDRALNLRARSPRSRTALRLLLLVTFGPVIEVLLNEWVFRTFFGAPLYVYTFLPTFGGSGSLLSPLYYATLLVHVPITDRVLYSSGASRSSSPETTSERAASMSGAA
ncbi:MAG: hypothetical protein JNK60_22260 [Acidobacteria bacterium]|nr:hypothetical protein [Acidobacteriota bacterium]